MSDEAPLMDGLIERSLRDEATEAELETIAAWRSASNANEQVYRQTVRLIAAARELSRRTTLATPPTAADLLAVGTRAAGPPLRSRAGRWFPWAVAAAAVLVAGLNVRHPSRTEGWSPAEIVTGQHEMTTVRLGDGTVVRLAPSTRLQVGGNREVMLEGHAYFAVTRGLDEPFLVRTRAATARVLGTRFELDTDAETLRLLVLEGRVALEAPENSVEVTAGEQTAVRDRAAARPTRVADPDAAMTWLGSLLVFQGMPLRGVVQEIQNRYGVRVLVGDSALLDETITAMFTDRSIEDVVGVICSVLAAPCSVRAGVVSIGR